MKTKHLFLATALVASLAACTNEEIVDVQQQNIANGRPTVDNVKLNFGMDADSRVVYDGGWQWNSTDVIGALLMDNVNSVNEDDEWSDKYELVKYIHTSYPFAYSDGAWSCNTKMLEGNYFFANPWASYDGVRQVCHSLLAQKQTGITKEVRGKAYAENNLFFGYQRIVAGTQAQDVLNDVKMYPVLGAIQLQIKNTGTQDRHINKVVLSGDGLYSTLTFDPTQALDPRDDDATGADFMSAEYLNISEELDDDFEPWTEAEKEAHILSVVKEFSTESNQNEGFVQVSIEGTKEERLLKAGAKNTAYVMVMANPVELAAADDLMLAIYTDEGVVLNINLTEENDEIDVDNNGKGTTAITSAVVEKIGPNTTNTIEVQIDDNSFTVPRELDVYTTEDLLQLIKWNANAVGKRTVTANLKKNVTLTEEVAEILATAKLITLEVEGEEGTELTIAKEVPATFFDEILNKNDDRTNANLNIEEDIEVIIEGTINVGESTVDLPLTLTVAEGAELNINVDYKASSTIKNEGTLNIAKEISVKNASITNLGSMAVGAEADVKATVVNGDGEVEAELKNNGYMDELTNNAGAVVKMGKEASFVGGSNEGLIITAKDAIVDLADADSKNGMIEYVDGAIVEAGGTIYQKITAAVTLTDDEDDESPVNALLIEGATVTINDDVDDFETIILGKSAKLKVNKNETLTVTTLETIEVEEGDGYKAYTQGEGKIVVEDVNVYEFTTLVNTTTIDVSGDFTNKGTVQNKGAVEVPNGKAAALNATDWDYTEATEEAAATPETASALDEVVDFWWKSFNTDFSWLKRGYANQNPYDVEAMVNVIYYYGTTGVKVSGNKIPTLLNSDNWNLDLTKYTEEADKKAAIKGKLIADYSAFVEAVDEYVFKAEGIETYTESTTVKLSAYNADYIDAATGVIKVGNSDLTQENPNLFNNSDAAMRDLLAKMVIAKNGAVTAIAQYKANLQIYKNITTAAVKTALEKTTCGSGTETFEGAYAYIWVDCALDKAVAVAQKYPAFSGYDDWKDARNDFYKWAVNVLGDNATSAIDTDLGAAGVDMSNVQNYLKYSNEQYAKVAGNE